MLELQNVGFKLPNGREILHDINIRFDKREMVVITGPNGAGKTTLAKILAGVESPTSGKILLDGEDITDLSITEKARKGIAYGFQQPVRFKGITTRDLLEMASGKKLKRSEACEMISTVGLCTNDYIDREVDTSLSGGEIKRIEIITALSRDARVYVFDEPEAGIDLWSFGNLINVFEQKKSQLDGTIIIISHQERILEIADRIALLDNGTIEDFSTRDEILKRLYSSTNYCEYTKERSEING
ncbi:MAG: ATP-binding cassette domain-containing protein [Tissierellia bacterium]|nr:ATP-binding cassette domain-containing protein [Tissierellia bacterium]